MEEKIKMLKDKITEFKVVSKLDELLLRNWKRSIKIYEKQQ